MAFTVLIVTASPAAAHNVGGTSASNFRTRVLGMRPALAGVTVRVIEGGDRLELTNRSATEVLVRGYQDEPYLRIGPEGVFENAKAPTTFLDKTRDGQAAPGGDPAAEPVWRRTGDGPTARWFDHRAHWTGAELPPEVKLAPGRRHVIEAAWRVPIVQGDTRAEVVGDLTWVPGPSPVPWYALALVVGLGAAALSFVRRWGLALAAAIGVLLAIDLVHTFGVAFAVGGGLGRHLATVLTGSFYALVGWVLAVVAIRLLRRENVDGLYAAVFAGLSIAVFGGVLDLSSLSRSVVPLAFPVWVGRLCVSLALGLGGGIAGAAALIIRRTPAAHELDPAPAPAE
jgi:hypothetical protein